MNKDTGGSAFPCKANPEAIAQAKGCGSQPPQDSQGMTLRDYFAAKAMAGFLSCPNKWEQDGLVLDCHGRFSDAAYEMADAMLEARK